MFYEVDKLETQLRCPRCNERYVSPRILPCGKSLCESCVRELSEFDVGTVIRCPLCCMTHAVPDEGFIVNEFIIKTLELKPEKVYRCASFEVFDNILVEIENDISELESKLNYPDVKIREHCDKIRNQIDLCTETLIEKINNYREQHLNEINQYEQSLIKNLKYIIDKKDFFYRLISDNLDKLNKFYSYINKSKIDEQQIKKMISDAKVQEYKLKNQLKILNGRIFGKNLINFEESLKHIDSTIIGKFNYESLLINNDLLDIEKVVNPKIEKVIDYRADMVLPLNSNRYLVSSGLFLKIIDEESNDLVDIRFDYPIEHFSHNNQDSVFVQHSRNIWKNNRKEKNNNFTLSIYDYNLNLKNEFTPDYDVLTCVTNNHNIFAQADRNFNVHIYSWSLEKIYTIGQANYVDRPYFFRDFMIKLVKNDRIYLKKMSVDDEGDFWIRIVSLTNGELLNEYYLNSCHDNFFVDALNRTIVVDDIFSNVKIYEKPSNKSNQADLIYEKSLDLSNSSGFRMTHDGKFFFIKNKQFIQYLSFCS